MMVGLVLVSLSLAGCKLKPDRWVEMTSDRALFWMASYFIVPENIKVVSAKRLESEDDLFHHFITFSLPTVLAPEDWVAYMVKAYEDKIKSEEKGFYDKLTKIDALKYVKDKHEQVKGYLVIRYISEQSLYELEYRCGRCSMGGGAVAG